MMDYQQNFIALLLVIHAIYGPKAKSLVSSDDLVLDVTILVKSVLGSWLQPLKLTMWLLLKPSFQRLVFVAAMCW